MARIAQETRVELAARELLALEHAEAHVLTCKSGELWITLDGSREDVILGPGQSWRVERAASVVVSALRPSILALAHPQGRTGPRFALGGRAEWTLALLLRWKHPPLAAYPATLLR